MQVICLDLEGVLVPEIWMEFADKTGIKELMATTRDIPDYDELMQQRLSYLDQHNLRLDDIRAVIGSMSPLPGARHFLDQLRQQYQVIILSDTFYEFASPLMEQLGWPTLFLPPTSGRPAGQGAGLCSASGGPKTEFGTGA